MDPNKFDMKRPRQTGVWNPVDITYPVNKQYETGLSSSSVGHVRKGEPEVLRESYDIDDGIKNYSCDRNVHKELMKSETASQFTRKHYNTKRFIKASSCNDNHYVYPMGKNVEYKVPLQHVYATSEMRSSFKPPGMSPKLFTDKDQYKYVGYQTKIHDYEDPSPERIEPLGTTYDGFEKQMDPYLTTNRLHHGIFTENDLNKVAGRDDVVTYYTFSDTTFVRRPKPKAGNWWLPLQRPKPVYDREKFKEEFREKRKHKGPIWVPGSLISECKDKFAAPMNLLQNYNQEEEVKSYFHKTIDLLPIGDLNEHHFVLNNYRTENNLYGSKKTPGIIFNQFVDKNERLRNKDIQ